MTAANPPFRPTGVDFPDGAEATRELLKYVPQLSIRERDRRWDQARKRMLLAGLDALLLFGNDLYWDMGMANLRYLTQAGSKIGGCALFFHDADPVVWNSLPHMNRPTSTLKSTQEWVSDIRPVEGLGAVAAELRARGLDKGRIGLVGLTHTIVTTPAILHGDHVMLEQLLPDAELVSAGHIVDQMRVVKSEEEIEQLRQAGRIARKVVDTMIEMARPGVTEAEYYAAMVATQIANGGEPNIFNLFSAGPAEHPATELWHLLHGSDQPLAPTRRPLQAGDLVISEFHTKYAGYLCHTEYTVYLGTRAPAQLRRIWDVSLECLAASQAALTPGTTVGEALAAIRKPADKAGLDWVELGFHAMGVTSPEFPTAVFPYGYGSNSINGYRIQDLVLEEGMCLGNNIDLHDPHWKPDVGCMLADFMVVRPGQAEKLINVPLEFAAVPV